MARSATKPRAPAGRKSAHQAAPPEVKKPKRSPKAARVPKPERRKAAYTPSPTYPREICPVCFSRPSVSGRVRKEAMGRRGWGIHPEELTFGKRKVKVYTSCYPCSNGACNTILVTHSALTASRHVEDRPWVAAGRLKGAEAKRFLTGGWDTLGVWRAEETLVQAREQQDAFSLQGRGSRTGPVEGLEAPPPEGKRSVQKPAPRKVKVSPELALLEQDLKDQLPLLEEVPRVPSKPETSLVAGIFSLRALQPIPGFRRDREGWIRVEYGSERYQALWEHYFNLGVEI